MPFIVRFFLFAVMFAALLPAPVPAQNAGARAAAAPAARADNSAEGYSLRPPPLSAPAGAPGAVRRSIMQFYGWTLLCDTVMADKKQICNVTQTVWDDSQNAMLFSWSLAASDKGEPFLLLRAPPDADISAPIQLVFSGGKTVDVDYVGCNAAVCMAQTKVGPILTKAIGDKSAVALSFRSAGRGAVRFETSFEGLKEAVAAIK